MTLATPRLKVLLTALASLWYACCQANNPYRLQEILGNHGRLSEALRYFEQAARLGDRDAAQNARTVRQLLGMP
jgi:hypothetical protein